MARQRGSPGWGERIAAKGLAGLIRGSVQADYAEPLTPWGTTPPSLLTLTPLGEQRMATPQ